MKGGLGFLAIMGKSANEYETPIDLRASANPSPSPINKKEKFDTKEDNDDGAPKEPDSSDNILLPKLLRGRRYFHPNCCETTANCTSPKRKKPCGTLEHQCNKGKDCFICKKGGHRAKYCPEKSTWGSQSTKICLSCGDSGHEMFSCESTYSPDDLKEIQCYVCKCFGHLCCVNYAGEGSREVSCYRCGQLGHSGRECARVHAETASKWTPSSCYMCGEEAHTVCRCTEYIKKKKRKMDSSTPKTEKKKKKKKKKKQKNDSVGKHGNDLGARSMHQPNPRGRGGWITGDPSAHNYNHNRNHYHNQWRGSPMYISNDRFQFHGGNGYQSPNGGFQFHQSPNGRFQFHGGSGYNNSSGFHSNPGMFHAPGSNGYQHASRFGNSSNYGRGGSYA